MAGNKLHLPMLLLLIFVGLYQSDAWALGLGGGGGVRGGRRGGRTGPRKDSKKEQEERDRAAHQQHVQQMPPLERCPDLETSSFDRFADRLKLAKEQEKRVVGLKERLHDRIKELKNAQEAAKNNFVSAREPECPQAAAALAAAIQACKEYSPTKEFEAGMNMILNDTQRAALKRLRSGGKPADEPEAKKRKPDLENE